MNSKGTFLYPAITEKLSGVADSVKLSGNNTFTGTNTFNNPVVVPNPTQNNQAINKGYVDDLLSKDITQEQLAPFKIGSTNVYMKYINNAITVPNTNGVTVAITGLPNIGKLISHSLTVDNHYILPWSEGSVNLRLVLESNVLKIKADNGSWVNMITGIVYYTKP